MVDDLTKLTLQARKTDLIYKKCVISAIFGVLVAVVLAVFSFLVESGLRGFFWLLCALLVSGAYVFLADRYFRDEERAQRVGLWFHRILALTFACGLVWGSAAWVLFTDENVILKFFLYSILVSVAAVSVSTFSSRFAVYASFSIPLLFLVACETLGHGGIFPLFGGFAILLCATLLRIAWTYDQDMTSMCSLEDESVGLRDDVATLNTKNRDITQKEAAAMSVLEEAGVFIWRTDSKLQLQNISPRLIEKLGKPASEVNGMRLLDLVGPGALFHKSFQELELALAQSRGFRDIDCEIERDNGKPILVQISARPTNDENAEFDGFEGHFKDVTASGLLIQQLSFQNQHDALTGLINRTEFLNRLSVFVPPLNLRALVPHVVYIDIRNLKLVNDTLGLAAGDAVFVELADVLRESIGEDATVSRLGGGAFGVLLHPGELSDALQAVTRAIEALNAYRYHKNDLSFSIQASAGIAGVTPRMESAEVVLNCAQSACRGIDKQQRNPIGVYRQGDTLVPGESAHDSVVDLLSSLENRSLRVQYQPVIDVASGETVWLEALLAKKLPDGTIKLIGERLSEAIKHGVVLRFDRWVVENVLREISAARSGVECGLIINLTAASMMDRQFPAFVFEHIEKYGVDPQRICFDVATGNEYTDTKTVVENMRRLTSTGCKLSLDDFGTVNCSLESLKHLPASFVKINHVYLEHLLDNDLDRMITQSIVQLAQSQNCRVIAESVQTVDMLPLLEKLGVELAQGFALGQPASLVTASGRTSPGAFAMSVQSETGRKPNVVSLPHASTRSKN